MIKKSFGSLGILLALLVFGSLSVAAQSSFAKCTRSCSFAAGTCGGLATLVLIDDAGLLDIDTLGIGPLFVDCGDALTSCLNGCPASPPMSAGLTLNTLYNSVGGSLEVRYIDVNQHLQTLWNRGVTWQATDLSAQTGAPSPFLPSPVPGTLNSAANTAELYYFSSDHKVRQLWYNGSWHFQDITSLTGAPTAAMVVSLTSGFDSITQSSQVFYLASDNHIHQLYAFADGAWHTQDLTASTGAPTAAGSAFITVFDPIVTSTDMYYVTSTGHMEQLKYTSAAGWVAQDLTTLTGASNASTLASLSTNYDPVTNTLQLYYVDVNQHLTQLYYNGVGWFKQDLTAVTGSPTPRRGSPLSSIYDPVAGNVEVYYISASGQIQQLYYRSSWFSQNLTAVTGTIAAEQASPLSSIYDPIANTLELYYVGTNLHIEQLYFNSALWHSQDLTSVTGAPTSQ